MSRMHGRPVRDEIIRRMALEISGTWAVVLQEHLEAAAEQVGGFAGERELVSHSPAAWALYQELFPALNEEFTEKLSEFRNKWQQRYSLNVLLPALIQGHWIEQDAEGWFFNMRGSVQELKNLYYETLHLMVGDAEKFLVMKSSRILHIQDRITQIWHKEALLSPASKILPSLEAGMRDAEIRLFKHMREGLSTLAYQHYAAAFKGARGKSLRYPTAAFAARNIGKYWNPLGLWETGFLGYLQNFCDYVAGLQRLMGDWYHNKWTLYLRGFSIGQLDLFRSRRGYSMR